ncbi:MAG: alpha/beta hydrolase [Pseudomonadota bacterium]
MGLATSKDGLSIYYDTFGDGLPLLIINGFGPPCEWMAEMYGKHFSDRFQYAVSDLRGVGRSDRPNDLDAIDLSDFAADHLAVMDALSWSSAHIYGGSMGASIAAKLTLLAPERVRSLTLGSFDCGYPNIFSKPFAHILKTRVKYGRSILAQRSDPEGAARVILETYYGDPDCADRPEVGAFVVKMLKEHPMETDFPPLQALKDLPDDITPLLEDLPDSTEPTPTEQKGKPDFVTGDLWQDIHKIEAKTLLLHGYDDHIVPYQSSVYAATQIPRAELRLIKPMHHSISGSPQILRNIGDWMVHEENDRMHQSSA